MSGRPSSAPSWTWEIWLLMRRPGANRRPAHVLHILDAVVGEVEVDEALEAAQLLVRQPPQARVGEVEPGQSAQLRQRPGLHLEAELAAAEAARLPALGVSVHAEVGGGRGGWRGAGGCARPAGTRGPPIRCTGWRAPGDHAEVGLAVVSVDRPVTKPV